MTLQKELTKLYGKMLNTDIEPESLTKASLSLFMMTLDRVMSFPDEGSRADFYINMFTDDITEPIIEFHPAKEEDEGSPVFRLDEFIQFAMNQSGGRSVKMNGKYVFKVGNDSYKNTEKIYQEFLKFLKTKNK